MTSQDLSLETIQYKLASTAGWRRGLAEKYADDQRNKRAAETLCRLAQADGREVSPETWAALEPHLDSTALREGISEPARDVEFWRRPANIDDFLKIIIEKVAAPTRH
jgi:hypothetical protein